jgi:hypothetical protein
MCIDIRCGATTLVVLEVFYILYLAIILAIVVFAGSMMSSEWETQCKMSGYTTKSGIKTCVDKAMKSLKSTAEGRKALEDIDDAARSLMFVGVGIVLAYIPRFYYFVKLCGFSCCGGSRRDTSQDRYSLVQAMNALLISNLATVILVVVVTLAFGGEMAKVQDLIVNMIISSLVVLWWRMDIKKWVASKENMEKGQQAPIQQ